jgi:hypothetical protein
MLPPTEQTYTFTTHTGEVYHFAVDQLNRALKRLEGKLTPVLVPFDETVTDMLKNGAMGVEPDHAARLPVEALERPVLVLQWGDGQHVICDGAHRLYRRMGRGDTDFPAYFIPPNVWRYFLITGLPGDAAHWREANKEQGVRSPCENVATRYGQDQYRCSKCGVVWDIDESRPACIMRYVK